MLRRTGTLNDIMDEAAFAHLCNVTTDTIRQWKKRGGVYGIEFPEPIYRPDGHKAVWMRSEIEAFARAYKAKKSTRRKQ